MILTPAMAHSLRYWHSLPKAPGVALPHRAAFDPDAGIARGVRVSLMKRKDRYHLEAELVRVARYNCWERAIAGINAFDLASPDMRENIARFCDAMLNTPCAALVRQRTEEPVAANRRDIATLYLPLLDQDGAASIILGLTSSPTPGLQPNLKSQIAVAHSQFVGLTFIDLGHGIADITFDVPKAPRPLQASRRAWWQRFLPLGSSEPRVTPDQSGPATYQARSYRPLLHSYDPKGGHTGDSGEQAPLMGKSDLPPGA